MAEETPFIIIRPSFSTFNQGFKLREGDVMKLGKQAYKIKEMKLSQLFKERTQCEKMDQNIDKTNPASQYINYLDKFVKMRKDNEFSTIQTNIIPFQMGTK